MQLIIDNIVDFLLSVKFYGPIITVLVGLLVYNLFKNVIVKIKNRRGKKRNYKKEETVINLIRNIVKYLIMIIVSLIVLEIYGVNTTSIIASLSVVGVVIGLAFQDTLKNMLAGILIIFDDRYNIGDVVEINSFIGEVISLGLQTTKLQAYTGEVFTIQNSNISTVINYTEYDSRLILDLGVSYNTDISLLEKTLKKLSNKVEKMDNVKGSIELLGINNFDSSQVVYRIALLCKPYTHYGVKRATLKIIKEEFDKVGIEIPYMQVDVHLKEEGKKKIKK